jgi:hypothetical protein
VDGKWPAQRIAHVDFFDTYCLQSALCDYWLRRARDGSDEPEDRKRKLPGRRRALRRRVRKVSQGVTRYS